MSRWLVVATLVSSTAWAQATPPGLIDLLHARGFAMGNAFRAHGYGVEAVDGNPAALGLFKRFSAELSGAWDPANGFGFGNIGLMDSQSSALAGGTSYTLATLGPEENRRTVHLTTVAAAFGIADIVYLGASMRYHLIVGGVKNTNSVTMNAGVVVRPFEFITFGFSAHNLIDNFHPDITRYFVASVSGMFGMFSPVFDLRMDFNIPGQPRFAFQGGLEWIAGSFLPLRLGYSWDGIVGSQYISGGIGFFSEGSGIDLAYRYEIGGSKGHMLAVTLKMQFN